GAIKINGREFEDYFPRETGRRMAVRPLRVTEALGKYDVYATVSGGGLSGQAGAVSLGIARALTEIDPEMRGLLGKEGLLMRDSRMRERKKYGQPGARKRFQFSKR
ncbi:MAG: 30S ribosomal protein S9, partial [Candidatus Eisenbacteria sp.]|nr:30S ribosomal protein S9 [Candidatus Eisenbacteria bacterium]